MPKNEKEKKTAAERQRDIDQLAGAIEPFDRETLLAVLREKNIKTEDLNQAIRKTIKDFPKVDRSKKSKVGDKNHVSREAYIAAKPLERIIDQPDFKPVHFLECGWNRQKPVARVHVSNWWGTGFLVSRSLIMTNNHVIENEAQGRLATAEFNYQMDHEGNMLSSDTWDGDPDSFFHTDVDLDYTVMRLKGRYSFGLIQYQPPQWVTQIPGLTNTRLPILPSEPPIPPGPDPRMRMMVEGFSDLIGRIFGTTTIDWAHMFTPTKHAGDEWGYIPLKDTIMAVGARINIIQHPQTRPKEVAMHDNELQHVLTDAIHYRTDTDLGSSGSPVFDNYWDIIALHHAAGDWDSATSSWLDNEGMRIDRIIDDLQANLRGTSEEHILTELGIP